jgi:hypothetical protein
VGSPQGTYTLKSCLTYCDDNQDSNSFQGIAKESCEGAEIAASVEPIGIVIVEEKVPGRQVHIAEECKINVDESGEAMPSRRSVQGDRLTGLSKWRGGADVDTASGMHLSTMTHLSSPAFILSSPQIDRFETLGF